MKKRPSRRPCPKCETPMEANWYSSNRKGRHHKCPKCQHWEKTIRPKADRRVYVVRKSYLENYEVAGIYTTKTKAEILSNAMHDSTIQEWVMNDYPEEL